MNSTKQQPHFWLEVKDDYVIENIDKLIPYLKMYNYDRATEATDSDFEKSCASLKNVADGFAKQLSEASLSAMPTFVPDSRTAIKVIAAAVLAANKRGVTDNRLIAALIHMMLLEGYVPNAIYRKQMFEQLLKCVSGYNLVRLGIDWNDVMNMSPGGWVYKMVNTTWRKSEVQAYFLENRGLVVLEDAHVSISPLNFEKFGKGTSCGDMSLGLGVDYVVAKTDKSKGLVTSRAIISRLTGYMRDLSAMRPSPKVRLRSYASGDELVVRVDRIFGIKIEATSTDPRYNVVSGNIQIPLSLIHVTRDDFLYVIKPGDYLLVRYDDSDSRVPFELTNELFDEFYNIEAEHCSTEEFDAVYVSDYSAGTQWRTTSGLLVNVYTGSLPPSDIVSLNSAIEDDLPIVVKIKSPTTDKNNHIVINAEYHSDKEPEHSMDSEKFIENAARRLVASYIEWSEENLAETDNRHAAPLDPYGVAVVNRYLVDIADDADKTIDRVKALTMAAIMAYVRRADDDVALLRHKLEYLDCIVKFASGESVRDISLKHSDALNGNVDVERDEAVVNALREYRQEADLVVPKLTDNADGHAVLTNIKPLIYASNILQGKINSGEISRIKMAIVDCLEVSDEFVPAGNNDTTYYGIESDTLEFKSSVVCPPRNRQTSIGEEDPEQQKWPILNAVCGFLNSSNGGDLLIGVKDNGYSCGIRDDIARLYKLGRIPIESADLMRLYVKSLIDKSFKAADGSAEGPEVVVRNVSLDIEINKEDHEILRIKVAPYYDALVEYRDKSRPDWVADSYIRTSGATMAMTDRLREKISDLRKRHLAKRQYQKSK